MCTRKLRWHIFSQKGSVGPAILIYPMCFLCVLVLHMRHYIKGFPLKHSIDGSFVGVILGEQVQTHIFSCQRNHTGRTNVAFLEFIQ